MDLHEIFDVFLPSNKKEGYRFGTPFSINLIQQGVSIRRLQTTFHNVRCYCLLRLRCINRLSLVLLLLRTYEFCLQM